MNLLYFILSHLKNIYVLICFQDAHSGASFVTYFLLYESLTNKKVVDNETDIFWVSNDVNKLSNPRVCYIL